MKVLPLEAETSQMAWILVRTLETWAIYTCITCPSGPSNTAFPQRL